MSGLEEAELPWFSPIEPKTNAHLIKSRSNFPLHLKFPLFAANGKGASAPREPADGWFRVIDPAGRGGPVRK
jgi:hypothetical protein